MRKRKWNAHEIMAFFLTLLLPLQQQLLLLLPLLLLPTQLLLILLMLLIRLLLCSQQLIATITLLLYVQRNSLPLRLFPQKRKYYTTTDTILHIITLHTDTHTHAQARWKTFLHGKKTIKDTLANWFRFAYRKKVEFCASFSICSRPVLRHAVGVCYTGVVYYYCCYHYHYF